MAARGSIAKQEIIEKLLQIFPDSFEFEKGVRIPIEENGEIIQIKIGLTAAKVNVPNPNGTNSSSVVGGTTNEISTPTISSEDLRITEGEKKEVEDLMKALNL